MLWREEFKEALKDGIVPFARRVGDRWTWIISPNTQGVEWSRTPDFAIEHAHFTLKFHPELQQNATEFHFTGTSTLTLSALQDTYTADSGNPEPGC